MMNETRPAHIEIVPASSAQAPVLENLLELYAHDFSQFHNLELGPDGRFGYRKLALYWTDHDRHPFLIKVDDKLAGLVLLKKGSEISADENVWDMAEFFVVRGHRRRGTGTAIAHKIWQCFPGWWEVRVMQSNAAAARFWESAITTFAGMTTPPSRFERDGKEWLMFRFEAKRLV